jgi:hypothetical protein
MSLDQIKIRTGLNNLTGGCSVASAAALLVPPLVKAKLSQQQLNLIVNGRVDAGEEEVKQILSVIRTMEYLQEIIQPRLPINWNEPLLVRDILIRTHEDLKNSDDPVVPRSWFIRLSITDFLRSVGSGKVFSTHDYANEGICFESFNLAEACLTKVRELDASLVHARTVALTAPRRASTITRSLKGIGFAPVEVEV